MTLAKLCIPPSHNHTLTVCVAIVIHKHVGTDSHFCAFVQSLGMHADLIMWQWWQIGARSPRQQLDGWAPAEIHTGENINFHNFLILYVIFFSHSLLAGAYILCKNWSLRIYVRCGTNAMNGLKKGEVNGKTDGGDQKRKVSWVTRKRHTRTWITWTCDSYSLEYLIFFARILVLNPLYTHRFAYAMTAHFIYEYSP